MPDERGASATTQGGGGDTSQHPAPMRHRVPLWALWLGLAGAPAAWAAQLLITYALSAHTCYPALAPLAVPMLGRTTLWMMLLSVCVVAIATSVIALVTAIRSRRATFDESRGDTHDALDVGDGRTRFMALGGIMMSVLFLVAVVAHGTLVLMVEPCVQVVTGR